MGRRRDGGTGLGGPLGSAPDGTEVEIPHHLLPRDYDIFGNESGMDRRTRASKDRSVPRSASRSDEEKA